MAITNAQMFTWIGITPAAARNAIIADFLSDNLRGLLTMTLDDVKETCNSYAKRTEGAFPVQLTPLHKQQMRSLVLWVKDMDRVQQPMEFVDGTTRDAFLQALKDALNRQEMRVDQKKIGSSFLDASFNNKLKSQSQWEKFSQELEATLSMIVGSNGIPLTYVIRRNSESEYDPELPYEEAAQQAVALTGEKFKVDARTVHQIILRNVHEDSDAYTYIKTLLRHRNGRRDMIALRERYSSDATRQTIINSAKGTLDNLRYKNERSFSFERFSAKLQRAYDELEENGRPVHNGDIVDALWARIQSSDIQNYLASLRVDYQRNPDRNYKLILQDIAGEVAMKRQSSFVPTARNVAATYTKDGNCPTEGVHTANGSIFIGNYDPSEWNHPTVKPHQQEILNAREASKNGNNNSGGHNRSYNSKKRIANSIKANKRALKKLRLRISEAKATLAQKESESQNNKDSGTPASTQSDHQAGNSFGGRKSRSHQQDE